MGNLKYSAIEASRLPRDQYEDIPKRTIQRSRIGCSVESLDSAASPVGTCMSTWAFFINSLKDLCYQFRLFTIKSSHACTEFRAISPLPLNLC